MASKNPTLVQGAAAPASERGTGPSAGWTGSRSGAGIYTAVSFDGTLHTSEALRDLLHYRLRIALSIGTLLGIALLLRNGPELVHGKLRPIMYVPLFVITLGLGAQAALLWRFPQLSLANLRRIEILAMGVTITNFVLFQFGWAAKGAPVAVAPPSEIEALIGTKTWIVYPNGAIHLDRAYKGLVSGINVGFGILAVAYGMLIPNTWRRCLAMMVVLMLAAELCAVRINLSIPLLRPQLPNMIGIVFYCVGSFAAIGLYGCYKLTVLQQEAQRAREVGQYILQDPLGSGGMGEVHRARHRMLRRPCAIKLIRPDQVAHPSMLVRFEREVQAMAQLTHPNAVEIYDYGRTRDGTLYYAMEYLPGLSLDALVRRHGRLPPARAVYLLRQVCRALREAHHADLIHRDVKPGNIFVTERGGEYDFVKLLDFGIVAYQGSVADGVRDEAAPVQHVALAPTESAGAHLTQADQILGTPAYMSPEQVQGAVLTPSSDIYSLGAVAYFMLVGRSPFDRATVSENLSAHLSVPPPAPSTACPAVPPDLDAVILRCLAKQPADRYASAAELESALAACACSSDWSSASAEIWWSNARPEPTPSSAPPPPDSLSAALTR